jgi:hypothetical protein
VDGEICAIYSHQKASARRDLVFIGLRLFETFRLAKNLEMYYLFQGSAICSWNMNGAFSLAAASGCLAESSLEPHGNTMNFSMD